MMPNSTDHTDLLRRAYAAYFRSGGTDQPAGRLDRVDEIDGRTYVTLSNTSGRLACYRLRNGGQLKRLVRIPAALKEQP